MITYRVGDLFEHIPDNETVLIPHITNNIGAWGSGFVLPLSKKYPEAEAAYRAYQPELGTVQRVKVGDHVWVYNMCAQHGIRSKSTGPRSAINNKPIRYASLCDCMRKVAVGHNPDYYKIYAPKFGSDRSGGTWEFIEELIDEIWGEFDVTIFTLRGE